MGDKKEEEEEEEGKNDESLILQKEANECQKYGEQILSDLSNPKTYKPFLTNLVQALTKREASLGRYNHATAQSYKAIGSLHSQMNDHMRAIVMLRTSFRIETFLYGKCIGQISGKLKELLLRQGLLEGNIGEVQKDVVNSMKHEVEGDIMRRFGDRRAAALEYQKAAKIEEMAFGRDNPDLAYLWRKMACLVSVKKIQHLHLINFEKSDLVDNDWMKQSKEYLSATVCSCIRKGDKYFQTLMYSQAIGEYIKATMMDRPKQHFRSRRRTPPPPRSSDKTVPAEKELKMLIAGNPLPARESRTSDSGDKVREEKMDQIKLKTSGESLVSEVASEDESIRSPSNPSFSGHKKSLSGSSHQSMTNLNSSKQVPSADYYIDMLNKSQDMAEVALRSSIALTSDVLSDDASTHSQPETAQQRIQPKQTFSASSLYQMVAKPSSRSLTTTSKKPKSESHLKSDSSYLNKAVLSKLATKTTKKFKRRKSKSPKRQAGPKLLHKTDSYSLLVSSPSGASKDGREKVDVNNMIQSERLESISTHETATDFQDSMIGTGDVFLDTVEEEMDHQKSAIIDRNSAEIAVSENHSERPSSPFIGEKTKTDEDPAFPATFVREKVVAWEIEKKRREATTRRSPQLQQQQMITPVAVFPKEELESSNNGDGSFLLFEDNTSSTPESVDLR